MEIKELKEGLGQGLYNDILSQVYGQNRIPWSCSRILECADGYTDTFTDYGIFEAGQLNSCDVHVFSAPGRIEVLGNHTDHQNGCVIAAAVDIDMIAVAGENHENVIRIFSAEAGLSEVDLTDVSAPESSKMETIKGSSESLILGVAESLKGLGYEVGGFNAYVLSDVASGSGISSSAAFEVLVGNIISGLFNNGKIDALTIARAGQIAENDYFGKPSGLMDQLACSEGGLIYIDFKDPLAPQFEEIDVYLKSCGYNICLINTGSSHEDLTEAYAQIPADMKAAASFFGKNVLREVSEDDIKNSFAAFVASVGERAGKRTIHFINEEERVKDLKTCLEAISEGRGNELCKPSKAEQNDADAPLEEELTNIQQFLELICESGDSSFRMLGNVCLPGKANESPMAEALDMSWELLQGRGAFRVHGGGFAGTILAIVPDDLLEGYTQAIEEVFGKGACRVMNIRSEGGTELI